MKPFNVIKASYQKLLKDLDSDYLSSHVHTLAKEYFIFTEAIDNAYVLQDFSNLPQAWEKFEIVFEQKPFNFISLGLYIGDMEYSIKKDYLSYLLACQHFIAEKLFSTFVYDLPVYQKNKELLPPFILFFQLLENPYTNIKHYFKDFTQKHLDTLASFNNLPEFETFINSLFLRSKKEYDQNSFENEYFLFNVENIKLVQEKNIYVDIILKNNTLHLPEDFIDYIKLSGKKLNNNPIDQQSTSEAKILQEFFIVYQKQKFDYLFPAKNIKTKTNKI